MIVIDVGCADTPSASSIRILEDLYKPKIIFGFDPRIDPEAFGVATLNRTRIVLAAVVAWTFDGYVHFHEDGSRSRISPGGERRPCIDLARFIRSLSDDLVTLKIDAEGAEYELLEHLHAQNQDERLVRILVEWHPEHRDPNRDWEQRLREKLRCPVKDWTY